MSEAIPCRQLTSLSPTRRLRDFVLWHPSRESHQQTHIKPCDDRIRFSACGSGPPGPIKSHHFMDSSWLRYQIPYTSKTSDCVYDHHLLISTPIFFILEALWRHDNRLPTRLSANVSNTISMSPSPSEKDVARTSKCFILIDFFSKRAYIAGVYCDVMMMMDTNSKEGLHRPTAMGAIVTRRGG